MGTRGDLGFDWSQRAFIIVKFEERGGVCVFVKDSGRCFDAGRKESFPWATERIAFGRC